MAAEGAGDDPVMGAPHEQGGTGETREPGVEAALAVGRLEVDVARRGEKGVARSGGVIDAAKLVDHDLGHGRIDQVRVGEHAPELALHRASAKAMGQQTELGTQETHDRVKVALDPRDGGAEKPEGADALGSDQGHLDRDPAAHRVADDMGGLDPLGVHHGQHVLGEPAGVVAAARRLARGPESRQIGRVDAVALAERGRGLKQRGSGPAEAVQEQNVGAVTHGQGGDPLVAGGHVVNLQQRRTVGPTRAPEHALEADRVVEVAAHRQASLLEGVDA